MALSEQDKIKYSRRLLMSRTRVLCNNGFFGLLLMHMKFALDESCPTAYTDGEKIAFSPAFMDELSDSELDFILMHEIMHVALAHCFRGNDFDGERFNIACDIVVNSNILKSHDMKKSVITLAAYGESMNKAPNGKHGYLYSAEEVYAMLPPVKGKKSVNGNGTENEGGSGKGDGSGKGGGSGKGSSGSPQKSEKNSGSGKRSPDAGNRRQKIPASRKSFTRGESERASSKKPMENTKAPPRRSIQIAPPSDAKKAPYRATAANDEKKSARPPPRGVGRA